MAMKIGPILLLSRAAMCVFVLVSTTQARGQTISQESKTLAYCERVYMYSAQLMQLKNNEGAAKQAARRATMCITGNTFMNERDGVVSGKVVEQWRTAQQGVREEFDRNQQRVAVEVNKCDESTMPILQREMKTNKRLAGLTFQEVHQKLFEQFLQQLGIRY